MDDRIMTADVPEFLEDDDEYDLEYRRTAMWDPEKGDFVRNGTNQVQECSGEDGYMNWCQKVAMTERYAALAYPDEIGAELEEAVGDDDADIVESQVERTVTEAIEVNPRTERVGDFEFSWDGDTMHCTFRVKGFDMDEFSVSI